MKQTEFEKECVRDARDFFRDHYEDKPLEPYLIAMHPQFGLTDRQPLMSFFRDQRTKDALRDILIGLVHKGATEVVFVSEIWRAKGDPNEQKKIMAQSQAWLRAHGSLEGFPGVQEYLMLTHYSDAGDKLHFAEIKEGRKLGKWEHSLETETSEGRFTNIFKRAREIEGN